ncbi:hypothetical protein A9404_04080 [Halothiobacillus diazotrophicus]|uniref:Uncharacterized protein n=1 Tax=Halothiobacillus diazotrophicus TaxID=1860122 RepID=A0A191ZFL0_9GAMM|nr:hypothetical protein [Halothiobacillus diazotrophicus]ANJ66666.1 hypothetical protein A9404_04080 [Halothiobacillus diazotrophicus]
MDKRGWQFVLGILIETRGVLQDRPRAKSGGRAVMMVSIDLFIRSPVFIFLPETGIDVGT